MRYDYDCCGAISHTPGAVLGYEASTNFFVTIELLVVDNGQFFIRAFKL